MVREKILQGWGKVTEFYFESGEIGILKKSQKKLKSFNMADLIPVARGGLEPLLELTFCIYLVREILFLS